MSLVNIILLNWNSNDATHACIASLKKCSPPSFHIFLIDNGSSAGLPEDLSACYGDDEQITMILLPENKGFSGGMNVGLRAAYERESEHIIVLNNDTIVEPESLAALVRGAQETGADICAPKICWADAPKKFYFAGGTMMPLIAQAFHYGLNKPDQGQFDTYKECSFLTGCCLCLKHDVIARIGMFDEQFNNAFFEDMDLCMRARIAGMKLMYIPQSVIYHKGSHSIGNKSAAYYFYNTKNRVLFARKYLAPVSFWCCFMPYFFSYRVLWQIICLACAGKWAQIGALTRGIGWHWQRA